MPGGEERLHWGPVRPPAHIAHRPLATASRRGRQWRASFAGVIYGGVAGLLLGATLWMVLGLQDLTGAGSLMLAPAADPMGVQPPQCTSLAIDRRRGHTTAEPCPGHVLPQREAAAAASGDRRLP